MPESSSPHSWQVAALENLGVRAAHLLSSLGFEEVQSVERVRLADELDLLYLVPRRLGGAPMVFVKG